MSFETLEKLVNDLMHLY